MPPILTEGLSSASTVCYSSQHSGQLQLERPYSFSSITSGDWWT
jgi:hypothetical protein